ncbi:hypothetical protein BKA70DRAFT_1405559 [Coprinopsis sp. MPI-PUGE-AT-0042]|nr:hypothetical protein BKA70DRAFT_1405559 [Coprinopsis sp. MPI-PUGE-AT-0042]
MACFRPSMPANSRDSQSELSRYLLEKVSKGDSAALVTFLGQISRENYSLNALDALLELFEQDSRNHPLTEGTRSRLLSRTRNLAAWMEASVQCCYASADGDGGTLEHLLIGVGSAIVACLGLGGEDITHALVTEPRASRAVLKLWSSYHDKTPFQIVTGIQERGSSMVVAAMLMFIRTEAGRQSLYDAFFNDPDELRKYSGATRARLAQLLDLSQQDVLFDVPRAQRAIFEDIWQLTRELVKQPAARKALCSPRSLGCWSGVLSNLAPGFAPQSVVQTGIWLLSQCFEVGGNPNRNLEAILDAGFLKVISRGLVMTNPIDTNTQTFTRYLVHTLVSYTAYPRTVSSLGRAVDQMDPNELSSQSGLPRVGEYWKHLRQSLTNRAYEWRLHGSKTHHHLCDSVAQHDAPSYGPSRSCSRCRMVVYCSSKCQKDDWEARHRVECDPMWETYLDRCAAGIRYSQRSRAFHQEIVLNILRVHHRSLAEQVGPPKCVLAVDLRQPTATSREEITPIDIDAYIQSPLCGDNAFINGKLWQVVQDFVANPSPNAWLVELRLPWNEARAIALLVEVVMKGNDFETRQSVVHAPHLARTVTKAA